MSQKTKKQTAPQEQEPVLKKTLTLSMMPCLSSRMAGGNRVLKITKERSGSGIKTQEFWTYTYYVRDAQGNVMATYERRFTTTGGSSAKDELQLDESHLYGSSRLGVEKREAENMLADKTYAWAGTYNGSQELILGSATGTTSMPAQNTSTPTRKLGKKLYELANHLGNVLVAVADRKLAVAIPTTTAVDYYLPDVVSTTDYSAFGGALPGRSGNSGDYRYGFNGKENDAETGTQDYGFRIYNPALGKFLSVDPLTKSYPMLTPYQFASNTPIQAIDLDGLEGVKYDVSYEENGETKIKTVVEADIYVGVSSTNSLHYQASDVQKIKDNLVKEYNQGFVVDGKKVEFVFNVKTFDIDKKPLVEMYKEVQLNCVETADFVYEGDVPMKEGDRYVYRSSFAGVMAKDPSYKIDDSQQGGTTGFKIRINPRATNIRHTEAHEVAHYFLMNDPNNPNTRAQHKTYGGIFQYPDNDRYGRRTDNILPMNVANIQQILKFVPNKKLSSPAVQNSTTPSNTAPSDTIPANGTKKDGN